MPTTSIEYAVSVTNLRLKYPAEPSQIFRDLCFAVPKGQKVLLLGPSGSGKSTLLQVLSGIVPNTLELPLKAESVIRPNSWGFVFQDPDTQFCMPFVDEELAFVLENLKVPREEMEGHMRAVLKKVGLQLTELHIPISTLSQGMKQRLALASVLLLEPEVLFLDEPSALLDPEGTEQIWQTVKQIAADKTVVIVEHKIDQVLHWIERVVLFNHSGEILADGAPELIFEKHRAELQSYGIWYPDVWQDYARSESYMRVLQRPTNTGSEPVISLREFAGFRGKKKQIEVAEAGIRAGEWIAIIGDNGAGKSTFLLSLMQLLVTSGTYELEGKQVKQHVKRNGKVKLIPPKQLAYVFQNPELQFLTNSVEEELAYEWKWSQVSAQELEQKVYNMAAQFQLEHARQRHPYQLSIGQKRRLSVASALMKAQTILLLDEPTFGQDARNTFVMLEMLEEQRRRGTTLVMITHDPKIVEHFATHVWRIERGKLVEMKRFGPSDHGADRSAIGGAP